VNSLTDWIKSDARHLQATDWCGTDTAERWQQNQNNPLFAYYVDNPVHYQINPEYFRSEHSYTELISDQTPVNIFLGCSHTFGIGHHTENTWHHAVTEHTGITPVNLALPGAGVEFSQMILMRYIDRLNIQRVYHFQPVYSRWLIKTDTRFRTIKPHSITDQVVQNNWSERGYIQLSHYRNVKAIQQMCTERDIQYWHSDGASMETHLGISMHKPELQSESDIPARDRQHFPVSWHSYLSKHFINSDPGVDWQLSI